MAGITSFGLQTQSARLINDSTSTLSILSEQLSSGKKSSNLTDYSISETKKLLDLRGSVTRHESYISAIDNVRPRLKMYGTTLERLSKITADLNALANSAQSYTESQAIAMKQQIEAFGTEVKLLLNQRVGDRYIYAGSRYTQAPCGDLLTGSLPSPPNETYPVTNPALPPWDPERIAGTTNNSKGWDQTATTIDDNSSLTYGIRSTETGIQQIVQGLRWMYAAANSSGNYTTYMASAKTELTNAITNLRSLEATAAQNTKTLDETRNLHSNVISDLKSNIENIQSVDVNEVATKITFYQSQLQASYSVTAKLAQLTILTYLR